MPVCLQRSFLYLFLLIVPDWCHAGGSGLNVIVVVNQSSSNSVILGNYYREKRNIPPQNVVRINWTGGNTGWTTNDFTTYLAGPFQSALASRGLTNQIDYVVLSMDIPYRVSDGSGTDNGTTSALFYGFKLYTTPPAGAPDSCSLPPSSSNSYAASECLFRTLGPGSLSSSNAMVMLMTASNLDLAKQIVDQGVLGDTTFPTQTVLLTKSTDTARNVRYTSFDDAIFNTRLRGNYAMSELDSFTLNFHGVLLGGESGSYNYLMDSNVFVPGAMADNLTSFGGFLFEGNSSQLNILELLAAGATASYGTITEPCNYLEKFPSPQAFFYQARGFSIGECYYQAVTNPFEGVFVGEPLSAPFAKAGTGAWVNLPTNALLSGTTNLALQFNSGASNLPLQQIDLFLDGLWVQNITNIGPVRSNVVNVTINNHPTNYLVPLNATIKSVASNLTIMLNTTAYSNATKVFAYNHGDRVELKSADRTKTGSQVTLSVSNSVGAATTPGTKLFSSEPTFLDSLANGRNTFDIVAPITLSGTFLRASITKTNGGVVTVSVTNNFGWDLQNFTQAFMDAINTNSSLQGADGLRADDLQVGTSGGSPATEFNLYARGGGWNAAQIQATLSGSIGLVFSPATATKMDSNVGDLMPRDHIYVTAGLTNFPATFSFNTALWPDGYHELAAVAYEGTHVHTQTRATQSVRFQNNPWTATLTTLIGASNAAVEGTLQFLVTTTTNSISKIELFSTGGSLTNVTGQTSATFFIAGTNLGIGLHPFYAVVTATNGKQYRTATTWIRLVGPDSPFRISITPPPPALSWPAIAGRSYDVLSQTSLTNPFALRATVVASNSVGQWSETDTSGPVRFYRVRTSQ